MTNRISKAFKVLRNFPGDIWQLFISYLPGDIGFFLRSRYWKKRLKFLGDKVRIDVGIYFQNPQYISIDDGCWIDRNVIILAGPPREGRNTFEKHNPDFPLKIGEVYLGKNVHIAPNCVLSGIGGVYIGLHSGVAAGSAIYSFSNHYRNLNNREDPNQYSFAPYARDDQQFMVLGPVYIGDYCGIGLHTIILPGTTMKRGTWAASGTIVSGTFPEQMIIHNNVESLTKPMPNLIIKE